MKYYDHSSAPLIDPRVIDSMVFYLRESFGDPSGLHQLGIEAREAVEESRRMVANLIGSELGEIIFTASGSEADNLAIKGLSQAREKYGRHIIVSNIEHHAILYSTKTLERHGFEITLVPVGNDGIVDPDEVLRAMRPDTILVSVMLANDQIGTIQPIHEISDIAHKQGAIVHSDAVSAMGRLPINVKNLKVDALSISARYINGPPGVGALYLKAGTRIRPQIEGGTQEGGRRSGYENIPAIIGFGKAAELITNEFPRRKHRLKTLDALFWNGLKNRLPEVSLNGHPIQRLPGHFNLWIKGVDSESLVLMLDERGIAVSMGSSCMSHASKASHVLIAIGRNPAEARCSLIVSLSPNTKESEIEEVLDTLVNVVHKLRKIMGTNNPQI